MNFTVRNTVIRRDVKKVAARLTRPIFEVKGDPRPNRRHRRGRLDPIGPDSVKSSWKPLDFSMDLTASFCSAVLWTP